MKTPRSAPLEITPEEFRTIGHHLVDRIAGFLSSIRNIPVTRSESPAQIRSLLGSGSLPAHGTPAETLVRETADLLFEHSLFNGHPRFWGYITASPAPIGALADLLAATVNPNVGAFALSPVATEIESQSVRWIAEMIGYPANCGGLLVSGGNMANFVCFLAARKVKTPVAPGVDGHKVRFYCSKESHTWVHKAAELFGLGAESIGWIPTDEQFRMNAAILRQQIRDDLKGGHLPFMVIGAAGTVGTGAIDPLPELASICREFKLWFHVDGAYGGFAAVLPDASADLKGLSEADSVAVDPHKWLYAPLEAGCALVRNSKVLLDTFSYHPPYYKFHDISDVTNFYELGPQNSRGFRALKVWLILRQVGREGFETMIGDDVRFAGELYEALKRFPELERLTHSLSITTFRYVPRDLKSDAKASEDYLNKLNEEILSRLQASGMAYPSNALVGRMYAIRVCIVNFRTTLEDILELPELVVEIGKKVDGELRQEKPGPLAPSPPGRRQG